MDEKSRTREEAKPPTRPRRSFFSGLPIPLVWLVLFLVAPPRDGIASHRKKAQGKSPHEEIVAVARVESTPARTTHRNNREFEEFDVLILSAEPSPDQDRKSDRTIPIDPSRRVHVVHDLACGGRWLDAKPGDRVDVKGEYVLPPRGPAILHFTHPAGANGSCGPGARHPDGYLKPHAEVVR